MFWVSPWAFPQMAKPGTLFKAGIWVIFVANAQTISAAHRLCQVGFSCHWKPLLRVPTTFINCIDLIRCLRQGARVFELFIFFCLESRAAYICFSLWEKDFNSCSAIMTGQPCPVLPPECLFNTSSLDKMWRPIWGLIGPLIIITKQKLKTVQAVEQGKSIQKCSYTTGSTNELASAAALLPFT